MRHLYDLTHETYPAIGEIGRLLTLTTLPVIAGETFEIETNAKVRLSQLRRPRTLTPVMDVFRNLYAASSRIRRYMDRVHKTRL